MVWVQNFERKIFYELQAKVSESFMHSSCSILQGLKNFSKVADFLCIGVLTN
jgi:hypothetical protein